MRAKTLHERGHLEWEVHAKVRTAVLVKLPERFLVSLFCRLVFHTDISYFCKTMTKYNITGIIHSWGTISLCSHCVLRVLSSTIDINTEFKQATTTIYAADKRQREREQQIEWYNGLIIIRYAAWVHFFGTRAVEQKCVITQFVENVQNARLSSLRS